MISTIFNLKLRHFFMSDDSKGNTSIESNLNITSQNFIKRNTKMFLLNKQFSFSKFISTFLMKKNSEKMNAINHTIKKLLL